MEKPIFTEEEAQALRKKYNPDGSLLRNQQMELLEMLKILGDICDKNDIQWWLSSGTLLGAIRHQGFVPWDDDVDIERMKISIVCRDMIVEPTVKVILKVAHTGEVGDGRIFVSDMNNVWSIRTGEDGDTVLRDKK